MGRKGFLFSVLMLVLCAEAFAAHSSNRYQLPSSTTASASCASVDSDRWYGDVDCDGVKDVGEEYFDEASGGGGGSGDITAVGDVTSGAAFDGTQGTTLTFNNAGGDGTLSYDGTVFEFNNSVAATLRIEGTSATSSTEPIIDCYHNKTAADSDDLCNNTWSGNDSAGNKTTYGLIFAEATTVTDGAETGRLLFQNRVNGTMTSYLDLASTGILNALAPINIDSGTIDGTTIGASSAADATFSAAFTPALTFSSTTSTGVTATSTASTLTFTSQSAGRHLSVDLNTASRITLRSDDWNTLLWRGSNTGSLSTLFTTYSSGGDALFDAVTDSTTSKARMGIFSSGNNDWGWLAGSTADADANHLALASYYTGSQVNYLEVDKATGAFDFQSGSITTLGPVSAGDATFSAVNISGGVSGGVYFNDTNQVKTDSGMTYIKALDALFVTGLVQSGNIWASSSTVQPIVYAFSQGDATKYFQFYHNGTDGYLTAVNPSGGDMNLTSNNGDINLAVPDLSYVNVNERILGVNNVTSWVTSGLGAETPAWFHLFSNNSVQATGGFSHIQVTAGRDATSVTDQSNGIFVNSTGDYTWLSHFNITAPTAFNVATVIGNHGTSSSGMWIHTDNSATNTGAQLSSGVDGDFDLLRFRSDYHPVTGATGTNFTGNYISFQDGTTEHSYIDYTGKARFKGGLSIGDSDLGVIPLSVHDSADLSGNSGFTIPEYHKFEYTAGTGGSAHTGVIAGMIMEPIPSGSGDFGLVVGILNQVYPQTSGTVQASVGGSYLVDQGGTGTIVTATGGTFACNVSVSGGDITDAIGVNAAAPSITGGGSIGTYTGVNIEEITGASTNYGLRVHGGQVVLNEVGGNYDVRMESDNDTNMFLLDASADTVSFGSATTTIGKTGTLGYVTTTTVIGSGTVGNTQAFLGKSSSVGCLMVRDTDNAGWTECVTLNGVFSCGIDADGVCDGTA